MRFPMETHEILIDRDSLRLFVIFETKLNQKIIIFVNLFLR